MNESERESFDDAICDAIMAARWGRYDGRPVLSHLERLLERFRAIPPAPVSRPARTEPDGETETLAEVIGAWWLALDGPAHLSDKEVAAAILASDWLAARDAENQAKTLEKAADQFGKHQRKRTQNDSSIHPYSEACAWLRDRAATLRQGQP